MARVSILMNAYNSEKFLQQTLDSVKAQTFDDYEIIFIDNCSTDNSANIALSFGPKLKLYQTPHNIPLGEARNFGLPYCKSEFLAFLDTDDMWYPTKLEKQIQQMQENPTLTMSYTSAQWISEEGKHLKNELATYPIGDQFQNQLKRYEINMQSVLLRKSHIDPEILQFNAKLSFSPDFNLFMKIIAKYPVANIQEILVKYRVVKGSLTKRSLDKWGEEFRTTINDAFALVPQKRDIYVKEFTLALAKADYYDARAAFKRQDKISAIQLLKPHRTLSLQYFSLYCLAHVPTLWNKVFNDV
jgi:glycosyltransferase involved in cell wall biosynthesis